jgi:hypothetical protein
MEQQQITAQTEDALYQATHLAALVEELAAQTSGATLQLSPCAVMAFCKVMIDSIATVRDHARVMR